MVAALGYCLTGKAREDTNPEKFKCVMFIYTKKDNFMGTSLSIVVEREYVAFC